MEQPTVSTICESACNRYVENYKRRYEGFFTDYHVPDPTSDAVQLLENSKYLSDKLQEMENCEIEPCSFDVRSVAEEYVQGCAKRIEDEKRVIQLEHDSELECLRRKHAVLESAAMEDANAEVSQVLQKRDELLKYKDNLTEVFERYSITPNNISLSDDTTIPELLDLYDVSISVCEKYFKITSNKILEKIKVPVEELNESEGWILLIGVFLGITVASPILLCWYAYNAIRSTSKIYTRLEELKVASALMYEGDFERFLDKDKYVVEEEDTTEIDAKLQESMDSLQDISEIESQVDQYINTHLSEMQNMFNNAYESVQNMRKSSIRALTEARDATDKAVEVLKESFKPFCSDISEHVYLDRKYRVGTLNNVIPVNLDMTLQNIVFEYSSSGDGRILDFIKILLLNSLMNVKEKHLYVTVADNTHLGTQFAEFFDIRFPDIITLDTEDFSKAIGSIKEEETVRIKTLKTRNIDEYNKECEEIGKVPLDYKLYIFTGNVADLERNESFKALMKHSAKFGIWIWYVGQPIEVEDCIIYKSVPSMEGDMLTYSNQMCADALDLFADRYEQSKDRGIDYMTQFASKYIPRDKWWTYDTKHGIELNFGLVDGDPDKGESILLGDAPVHGNMVGTTGAGKSACINQLLASLITKYSPNELELIMIDFKNVEFSFFADTETHTFSRLPHAKVLAGTKDGEYAVSIFEYLCAEMDRRTAIYSKANVKNLEEYRNKYPDVIMPRILVLIDEYQVMFTELPPKVVAKIMKLIRSLSKLARFCGCHMFFTSQSMKGTMEKDVQDQFALRVALRCSADTAVAVLGDDAPSKLKSMVGYLYTNLDGGNTKDRNKLWRIPFIPTSQLNDILVELNKMWDKPSTTEFYDEKRSYTDANLHEWYDNYTDIWVDPHRLIIGEKTEFSLNKAPANIELARDDGENLVVFGSSTEDNLNIVMTLVDNIKRHSDKANIIMHTADRDAYNIIDIPSIVGDAWSKVAAPDYPFDKFMDTLEGIINGRRAKGNPSEWKPIYVFCLYYEKLQGYGRNMNGRVTNRFEQIMMDAPSVDMHFICVHKNRGDISQSSFKKFNHKILTSCDATVAYQLCENDKPSTFPTNPNDGVFGLYSTLGLDVTFKVYQHVFAQPIVSNEIFIG